MADLERRGPLHGREPWVHPHLKFAAVSTAGLVLLFGRPDAALSAALAELLGHALPDRPGRLAGSGPHSLMLAPGRWAIFAPESLRAALEAAVAPRGVGLADLGEGRARIDLSGPLAPELLAAGTAVDLDPAAWPAGTAAQTQLGRVSALLCRFDAEGWSVFVDASVADHVWQWLAANAALVTAIADRG